MQPPTDRDHLCDRHLQRAHGAMAFRFARRSPGGVLNAWQCARRVAGPLDHRMFAPSGAQAGAKARAGTVADGLAAP